jgi:hypothetical protein
MTKNRKVTNSASKPLNLRRKIIFLASKTVDLTLLMIIFIKNSLLMACSRETHPTIRRPETGGQIGPEDPSSDGPETLPTKGLAANKRPVTVGYNARQEKRQIAGGGWRCCQTNAT